MSFKEFLLLATILLILWHLTRGGSPPEQIISRASEQPPYRTPSM